MNRRCAILVLVLPALSAAQVIETIAGNARRDGLAATETTLVRPHDILVDPQGNILIADTMNHVIRKIDARTGLAAIVAGGGSIVDGTFPVPARSASLERTRSLAMDGQGNIFFSEERRARVRKLAPDGTLTTVAGNGNCSSEFTDNVPALDASLCDIWALAADRAGNLYLAGERFTVFRVDVKTGRVRRLAGGGAATSSGDGGPALDANLSYPWVLALDGQENLYIGEGYEGRVRRVDAATGIIKTVAGGGTADPGEGGPATQAALGPPFGLAFEADGDLLLCDGRRVRRVDAKSGVITTVAGGGFQFRRDNISGTLAGLDEPAGVAVDLNGNIYIAEQDSHLIRRVDIVTGFISTAAGTLSIGDGGNAIDAPVLHARQIAVDFTGAVYFADGSRIRKIDAAGKISTVAGTGAEDYGGDGGPATAAMLSDPSGVFVNNAREIFIADTYNHRIRKVDAAGNITTIAGTGVEGFSGDGGPATSAQLRYPRGVAQNAAGTLFIADTENRRVRSVSPAGVIQTVAGNGTQGYAGDGGAATSAQLSQPSHVTVESTGNLLITDDGNHTVRRVNTAAGTISTVAGNGNCGSLGDGGPAAAAQLCGPFSSAVDTAGNIYITDPGNSLVRRISAAGSISRFAGTGSYGFGGDGDLPARARLAGPRGVATDAAGNVFITDADNHRVRKVTVGRAPSPLLTVAPPSVRFSAPAGQQPSTQTVTISNLNSGSMNWTANVATTSGGSWLNVAPVAGTASPSSNVTVSVNTAGLAAGTYQGTITVTSAGAAGSPFLVPVTLTLGENATARPAVSAQFLRFVAIQGDPPPAAHALAINSPSSGTLNWTAAATTSAGGNWVTLNPTSGTAPSTLSVGVNHAGLDPGIYQALVSIRNTASGETIPVAVTLAVSAPTAILLPSRTSFIFQAVAAANRLAPQTMRVFNAGRGTLNWSIRTIYPAGGNWLTVSPENGSSTGGAAPAEITVTANPSGLSPGAYGAVLVISSPGAADSPALVTVNLNLRAAGSAPVSAVDPAGLVFVAASGSVAQPQRLRVNTSGGATQAFTVTTRTGLGCTADPSDGLGWLSATPSNPTAPADGSPIEIMVTAAPGQLPSGVRLGCVTIRPTGGAALEVPVTFVITPVVGPTAKGAPVSYACTPSRQLITPLGPGANGFSIPVGWQTQIGTRVTDDCGNLITSATVVASFTTESGQIVLTNLRNGDYSGQWTPRSGTGAVGVNLRSLAPPLAEATLRVVGTASPDPAAVPVVPANAAVHGASFAKNPESGLPAPLAPGSIFSLFGSNLALRVGLASQLPLPSLLEGAQLRIGDSLAPLFYVSPGQINAQVPWELAGRSTANVAVAVGNALSGTETVSLAPVQPGIFSANSSGTGQGAILDGQFRLADASNPVARGDVIQIYATGLGPVTPPARTGEATPGSPLTMLTTPVQCRIGGADAEIIFAGLAPGFVGLYQVNARVPASVTPGSAVNVVLSQGSVTGNTVTIAVR